MILIKAMREMLRPKTHRGHNALVRLKTLEIVQPPYAKKELLIVSDALHIKSFSLLAKFTIIVWLAGEMGYN